MNRIPSRRMPKFVRQGRWFHKAIAFAVLAIFLGVYLYAFWTHPLVIALITGAMATNTFYEHRKRTKHLARLAAQRSGEDIGSFARATDFRKMNTWVIRAVYEGVQGYVAPGFPLRPEDRFEEDLNMDPDDVELDLLALIPERLGFKLQDTKDNPYYGDVRTVEDLIRFMDFEKWKAEKRGRGLVGN
jgi:hypothetical protein